MDKQVRYVCPTCQQLLECVGVNKRAGDHGSSIDLSFECPRCPHMIGITINVPNGLYIPADQMWNYKGGIIPRERTIVEVDNRDERTTWLWLNQHEYIEVDPVELHANMLENCCCEPDDCGREN